MNIDRLQEFVMIAEKKSIKKAAVELNVSPAALRARFRSFEQSLGIPLFRKNCMKMELTKKGVLFFKSAAAIVDEYQDLRKEISSLERIHFSNLYIANQGYSLPFFLGPFLDMINSRYPYMQLDILDDTSYSITDGLLSGKVDFYFASALDQFHPAGITKFLISHTQPYILLPSDHRLSSKTSVSMQDLDHERFILYPPTKESSFRDFQILNIKAAGIHYSFYEHHTSPAYYELLVPIRKGILLSPSPFLKEPPDSVAIPVHGMKYEAASYLFYCLNNARPEIRFFLSAFMKFMKEEARHDHAKSLRVPDPVKNIEL